MSELILMLTRSDETVADARELFAEAARPGLRQVGFKDIGLPKAELEVLADEVRAQGSQVHLEVVSESVDATLASARMACDLGVDYLLGGTVIEPVLEIIAGTGIKFFPYVGEIVGHPCLLRGTVERIVEGAQHAEAAGADGINLLAYRHDGNVPVLIDAVVKATSLPVICAGSIASVEQVETVSRLGSWGFTIGTAILDLEIVPGASLGEQVDAAIVAAG